MPVKAESTPGRTSSRAAFLRAILALGRTDAKAPAPTPQTGSRRGTADRPSNPDVPDAGGDDDRASHPG